MIKTLNNLISAAFFMTLGSTLLTTLLIVYRIHSVVRKNGMHRAQSPLQNVLELLVQSAAPYAVVCLLYAIEGALPQSLWNGWTVYTMQYYTGAVFSITAVCLSPPSLWKEYALLIAVLLGNGTYVNGGPRRPCIFWHACARDLERHI